MKLVEKHIIKRGTDVFKELDYLCFLSKNLYNAGLYAIRQHFFATKKFKNYIAINNEFIKNKQIDYYALNTQVSQQTLKIIEQNFKSFFSLLNSKKLKKVRIPKYLNKKGRFMLIYTNQRISKKYLKQGIIKPSGTSNIFIKTKQTAIRQVRFLHRGNHIVCEIVYQKEEKKIKLDNNRYCSIDLGVNNLATIGSNVLKSIIINGRPLKSINQFFNKKLAFYKSELAKNSKKKSSNRIKRLFYKRNNKIKDYLHKTSRYIVNFLVSNKINTLVIGKNKLWKQNINIGKKNNQNFVQIPYDKFNQLLSYKCKLEGINVILHEESYTSKCSFLDNEKICKHKKYLGKRIKRGLFQSSKGKLINADLNGALNILKKVVGEFQYPIEVCSMPSVLKTVK